jgi:hypothetical protein
MELSVVTKTSFVDFLPFSWRQIKLIREAFVNVMKRKKELENE